MWAVINQLLTQSIGMLIEAGYLPREAAIIDVKLRETKATMHGDYSTNVALRLSKISPEAPQLIAMKIVNNIQPHKLLLRVEAASVGFINFFVTDCAKKSVVRTILQGELPRKQSVMTKAMSGLCSEHQTDAFWEQVLPIQYAHARASIVLQQMEEKGLGFDVSLGLKCLELLQEPQEKTLIQIMWRYEEKLILFSDESFPPQLTICLIELAMRLHQYYNAVTLVCESIALQNARFCLLKAVRQTLMNGLQLLGVTAPESVSWLNHINKKN